MTAQEALAFEPPPAWRRRSRWHIEHETGARVSKAIVDQVVVYTAWTAAAEGGKRVALGYFRGEQAMDDAKAACEAYAKETGQ